MSLWQAGWCVHCTREHLDAILVREETAVTYSRTSRRLQLCTVVQTLSWQEGKEASWVQFCHHSVHFGFCQHAGYNPKVLAG